MTGNPFAGLVDEAAHTPEELLAEFLGDTKRPYAKMRKVGIQRPKNSATRPSMLPDLVRAGKALDTWLTVLALEPVLSDSDPIPLDVWVKLIGAGVPISAAAVSRAFATLERLRLIERRVSGQHIVIRPLKEDGSGDAYTRPGMRGEDQGPGFFTIPHAFWLEGYAARLRVPGKIALLIGLAETSENESWEVPITRAQEWYGISERTLERGYRELSREGLTVIHTQSVRSKRSATGLTTLYHRALIGTFSTAARKMAQKKASEDVLAAMQSKKK